MSVSFNGTTIPLAQTEAGGLPRRDKVIEFPGADGVESLDMGLGARTITVRGVASGGTPSRSTLEGLMDGERHTLSVDGDSYGNCKCVDVIPGKRIQTNDGYRRYFTLVFRQEVPD